MKGSDRSHLTNFLLNPQTSQALFNSYPQIPFPLPLILESLPSFWLPSHFFFLSFSRHLPRSHSSPHCSVYGAVVLSYWRPRNKPTIQFTSYNVKGLNIPKRCRLLHELQHLKSHMIFPQELNLATNKMPKHYSPRFPTVYHRTQNQNVSQSFCLIIYHGRRMRLYKMTRVDSWSWKGR